ncbi:MAG: acetoacetate--CoA ligase [Proteobacteria bacterium]|nr:MAG: acetoacetate--CoA ligase [Pseudomonadota bacterium]
MPSQTPLWTPSNSRKSSAALSRFAQYLGEHHAFESPLHDFASLHSFSVNNLQTFWSAAAQFLEVKWITPPSKSYSAPPSGKMIGANWFAGSTLSYADNMLSSKTDETVRIISIIEGLDNPVRYTGGEIYRSVARLAAHLRSIGIKPLDTVAGVMTNSVEAIIAMLATNAIGAIWSSSSPDFGEEGIVDRFGQILPKVLFVTGSYQYNGKTIDCRSTIQAVLRKLPSVKACIAIDPLQAEESIENTQRWSDVLNAHQGAEDHFQPLPTRFDHPLYILYSSGTTGKPKCIVHTVGGSLIQHKKELILHSDIGPDSRLLYFTTCGWMMWNWMASGLSTGAKLVLFEGSIMREDAKILWRTVAEEKVTCFGTSAKFIATSMKEHVEPSRDFDLSHLETILSTGSPLLPEHFSWIYSHVKEDLHLASISGGTDIVSCFMLGNPWSPVYSGEIQGPGLGMAVECWSEDGKSLIGEKGELVCTKPFPAMPLGFWNDDEGKSKYKESYFSYFPSTEVWRHGDFIEINEHLGITVFGRSDATLNPGGVRIGTAEIYRQVEDLSAVADSLAVSHDRAGDAEMLLFVKLKAGEILSPELDKTIRTTLRKNLSPRHVPAAIYQVQDIPYTRSGKKLELAVTRILSGRSLDNQTAIANPECLDEYRRIAEKV